MTVVRGTGHGPSLRIVQEVSRGWRGERGQSVTDIVEAVAGVFRARDLGDLFGDGYAPGWVGQAFATAGIRYHIATLGQVEGTPKRLTKSRAYIEAEPLFAQGRVQILD